MSSGSHVQFAFHYRVTEFMRLIVDDVDIMETDVLMEAAEWMMKKIRGRVCPFAARFSIDEEDEVEVDNITVAFLFDLLLTCQKRQVERVDFELESEPRTVCWKCHTFAQEKSLKESPDDIALFEPSDIEFDAGFIEFLKKLEQRQEMIKESALRLLSPPRPSLLPTEQGRLEKSVQTTSTCTSLPADAFVPELPSPDLAEFHDAQVDIASTVDHFVDALFDFEPKSPYNESSYKSYSTSCFFPSRHGNWGAQDYFGSWERSFRKTALPWTHRTIQQVNSIRELDSPSVVEDLIALHDSASISHRMQKKWDRRHSGEASLSMTAALSTGVGGVEECPQEAPQSEKKSKRRENEEWIAALLKMLEQKPTKSRKLLRGLINYSKEHKSSKSSKSRNGVHSVSPSKNTDTEVTESSAESGPTPSENVSPAVDVYEYMRMKLKEHEKSKKKTEKVTAEESKLRKTKKEKNQNDIRVYMVGRKIAEPSCKTCGAQADIRDFLVGKKVKCAPPQVEVEEPSTLTAAPQKEQTKVTKVKSSSKSRIVGKYVKLNKAPTVAVVGESTTRFVGRLSSTAVVYGKTFKLTNLSRKDLHLSVAPIDWPEHVQLLHPISSTVLTPGQTKDMAVTVTRSSESVASECHLLSIVHRKTTMSHVLTFKIDAMAVHHQGPLLTELYTPEEVKMITTFRPVLDLPRPLDESHQEPSDEAETTETVHTVVNMLKDEVDSMCTGIIPQQKIEAESVHTVAAAGVTETVAASVTECKQLTESVHTAIEEDAEEECIVALEEVTITGAEEEPEDSSGSDFEFVDVDEGGSMSSETEGDESNA